MDAAFQTQRLLCPDWPKGPIGAGIVWMNVDPARAAALWLEAIRRREHIDRDQSGSLSLYASLMLRAAQHPAIQQRLLPLTAKGPEFALIWLRVAAASLARRGWSGWLRMGRFLQNFPKRKSGDSS